MSAVAPVKVCGLKRVSLTTGNAVRLAIFYEQAFGCRQLAKARYSGADFERLMGVSGGADSILLGLGLQSVELLQFDCAGQPYPPGSRSSDLAFQHFAIVVSNMARAMRRLAGLDGWSAISTDGPQRLPARSGGVTAFKFRDPDGHPLELLAYPDNAVPPPWRVPPTGELCLGIDHSAIGVADTARSIAFYQALGLEVSAQSLNTGPEQARLDGVHEPCVEVTALTANQVTPHIELLCYRAVKHTGEAALRSNDVAATLLVLDAQGSPDGPTATVQRRILDPDHHQLLIG